MIKDHPYNSGPLMPELPEKVSVSENFNQPTPMKKFLILYDLDNNGGLATKTAAYVIQADNKQDALTLAQNRCVANVAAQYVFQLVASVEPQETNVTALTHYEAGL